MKHKGGILLCLLIVTFILLTGPVDCHTPNNELPADLECAIEVIDVENSSSVAGVTGDRSHPLQEQNLRLNYPDSQGNNQTLMYYLRPVSQEQASIKSSCKHYTAWLMPRKDISSQSAARNSPPGLVSLCDGAVNGTLPVNDSHVGSVEISKPAPTASAESTGLAGWRHKVGVHRLRSQLAQWQQLDSFHRALGDRSALDSVVWPTQRPLHRVRRYSYERSRTKYRKNDKKDRLPFVVRNVKFNLHKKFLTKFGPFVIQLHLYLDPDYQEKHKGDKAKMVATAKEIFNIANTALRPFNTYVVVSSFHFPDASRKNMEKIIFPGDNILKFLKTNYFKKMYKAVTNEIFACSFVFLGRGSLGYTLSDSKGSIGPRHPKYGWPNCLGYVITEIEKENFTSIAGLALAHELAHRLDRKYKINVMNLKEVVPPVDCTCKFPVCALEESVARIGKDTPIGWSACGMWKLVDALDKHIGMKGLVVNPFPNGTYAVAYSTDWGPTCGNGMVEDGEDCDCGLERSCRANRCCQAATCKLASGAKCGVGNCCDLTSCSPRPAGSVCRPAADPLCDFPEHCDGKSAMCPPDAYISDYWFCGDKLKCLRGHCVPLVKQSRWERHYSKDKNYTGPGCPDKNKVPINLSGCREKPKPAPVDSKSSNVASDQITGGVGNLGLGGGSLRAAAPVVAAAAAAAAAVLGRMVGWNVGV